MIGAAADLPECEPSSTTVAAAPPIPADTTPIASAPTANMPARGRLWCIGPGGAAASDGCTSRPIGPGPVPPGIGPGPGALGKGSYSVVGLAELRVRRLLRLRLAVAPVALGVVRVLLPWAYAGGAG